MRNLVGISTIFTALVLMSALAYAQADQTSISPPLSQPLVREGDFATTLADSLKLGPAADETEAESTLNEAGIAPRNGWIADYPVTPDIVGELQTAVGEAAEAGRLGIEKDEALNAFQNVITQYTLDVRMDASGREVGDTSGAEYDDPTVIDNYYYDEGPPVVTYYAPPPDYSYLYTWVPYPFWWWNFWFPGFFVLTDFHVRVHDHGHGHGHGEPERDHGEFVSNHYRDPRSGRTSRVDPTNRWRGGTFPAGGSARWSSPSAPSGAQSIVKTRSAPSGRAPAVTTSRTPAVTSGRAPAVTGERTPAVTSGQEFRGYGSPRSSVGTKSSVFDRSGNSQVERSSGNRGIESRTNAGQMPSKGSIDGGASRGGVTGGSPGGGSRGGGGGSVGGGGGRR